MKRIILIISFLIVTFFVQAQEKMTFQLNGETIEFTISQEEIYVEYAENQKSAIQRMSADGFEENMNFSGSTIRNTFQGNYSFENGRKLIYTSFITTKVNEPDWGILFYDKVEVSYNQQTKQWENPYNLQDNNLKIYYAEQEYMLLEKL